MSEKENTRELVDTTSIDSEIVSIANNVLEEKDPEKAKQLIELFNWNISKKNTSRILKLNQLYDNVTDQMVTRFRNKSDQFSNSDLLDYMKAVQGAIDTSTKNLDQISTPPTIVQQNNTQINLTVNDSFDRDAQQRILAAIQDTLKSAKQSTLVTVSNEENLSSDQTHAEVIEIAEEAIKELDAVVDNRKEPSENGCNT